MLSLLGESWALAHEYAYDQHATLAALGAATPNSRAMLRESADLALRQVPELLRSVRSLADDWEDQQLLDPEAAAVP